MGAWVGVRTCLPLGPHHTPSHHAQPDHILEHDVDEWGTNYFTTGAGSDVRANNVEIPEKRFQYDLNGFNIASFNATHASHILIDALGNVLYSFIEPLHAKRRNGNSNPAPAVQWFSPSKSPAIRRALR